MSKLILLLVDTFFISLSWILAYFIRFSLNEYFPRQINQFEIYLKVLPFILILWLIAGTSFGLYKKKRGLNRLEEILNLIKSVFLSFLTVMAICFLLKNFDIGRSIVFISSILNFPLLGISHYLNYQTKRIDRIPTLILGAGVTGVRALQKLQDSTEGGYNVIGFLDDDPQKSGKIIGKIPVLGPLEDLRKIIETNKIEEIFIALPSLPRDKLFLLIEKCSDLKVSIKLATSLFAVISQQNNFELIDDFPILNLNKPMNYNPAREFGIRAFDLVFSLLFLALTLPLWVLIGIGIKITSPGMVFFKHTRVGMAGKNFIIFKFRTMYDQVGPYSPAPLSREDSRVTEFGKILRRTSLDELPQLINVIRGEMSLVGPRPEMPFIVEKYEPWQRKRLEVKPGITGLWQILGRKDLPLHEHLEYDFYYMKNRSLLFNLTILLKTIPTVILGRGAY